ncbi:hypothetical protein EON62_06075, partial [archaeon]
LRPRRPADGAERAAGGTVAELEEVEEVRMEEDIVMRKQRKRLEVWRAPPVLVIQLKRFRHTATGRGKLHNLVHFPLEYLTLKPYMARTTAPHPPPDLSAWKWLGGKMAEDASLPAVTAPPPASVHRASSGGGAASNGAGAAPGAGAAVRAPPRLRQNSAGAAEVMFDGLPLWLSRSNVEYTAYAVVSHYGALGSGHYVAYAQSPADGKWHCYNDRTVSEVTDASEIVSSAAYLLFYVRRDVMAGWQASMAAEDVLCGRPTIIPRPLRGAEVYGVAPRPAKSSSHQAAADDEVQSPTTMAAAQLLDAWDLFPHRAASRQADITALRARVANMGVTAEALGILDMIAEKCTIM